MSTEDTLIPDDLARSIIRGLAEEDLAVYSPEEAVYILQAKWEGRKIGNPVFARDYDWTVTFSDEFEGHTSKLDKKLQGRILVAIMEVSKDPMAVKGDTQKPLGEQWKGCWDHRTGDYRLIYFPDSENMTVKLVTFGPRGEVYKQR